MPVRIAHIEDLGSSKIVTATAGDHTLKVRLSEEDGVRGETGWLVFPPERSLLYRDSRLLTDPAVRG